MLNLVTGIHGCALQPERWQAALGGICSKLGTSGGLLWSQAVAPRDFGIRVLCLPHAEAQIEYVRDFQWKDAWMQACLASGPGPGEVVAGSRLLPTARLHKTAFYCNYLRRFDYAQALMGVLHRQTAAEGGLPDTVVALYRGRADAPFGDGECATLQALLPHMQQATAINFYLADCDRRLAMAQCTANLLHPALFLLDGEGGIVQSNPAAHALLALDDGLRLKEHRLQAANAADQSALNRLFAPGAQAAGEADAPLYLTRPSGKKPYIVVRIRMAAHSRKTPDARRPYQVALVHDPECGRQLNLAALRARYALSTMECAVLEALVNVGSPKAIATHLMKSENTVRTHLKSIFSKTGTHRQSELVQLALAVPDF